MMETHKKRSYWVTPKIHLVQPCEIFIRHLNDRAKHTLSKFYTKLRVVIVTLEGDAVIQKNLERLEKWADRNLIEQVQKSCSKIKPQAPVHAGNCPAGKQLRRNGPGWS